MNAPSTRDLLTLLVAQGHLSEADAQQTRRRQQRSGMAPELALMDLGELSQEIIYRGVAQVNNLPFVVLATTRMEPEAIKKVSPKVVLHYKIMPVKVENGILTIAFSSPPDHRERENLRLLLSARIQPVIASPADIHRATKGHYGLGADTVLQIRTDRDMLSRVEDNDYDKDYATDIEEDIQGASITQLVNQILLEALEMTATDVHIEPFQDSVRLRYRIDGVMREIPTPQGLRELHSAIISRLKIMASLNIAEKRLPHDGRIRLTIGGEEFDLRVSIMPTRYGETLNMRILNRASVFYDLEQLGLEKPQYELMLRLLNLSHGMILVTGPTGSGKTTTLYSSLDKTDKDTRKVITVEDPIEYQLFGISQIQIHDKIGLTFARCLRSILRHDPDIVLVGEIRDSETAEIAIRAALTGHLVLSTLHTHDSVGAVNRLVDMGLEPFLVASSLAASLAQRLVRRICPHCKEPQTEIQDNIRLEIADVLDMDDDEIPAWQGKGCLECDETGYRGRVAVYEFFLMNEDLADSVARGGTTTELRAFAIRSGMITLRQDGWRKVAAGLTTIKEIQRITSSCDVHY